MTDKPKRSPNSIKSQFKRGEVHNPLGAGAHDKLIKAARRLTSEELAKVANIIISSTLLELKAMASDDNSTILQRMVMSLASRVIEKGDTQAWEALMSRLVGKVPDKIDVTATTKPQVVVYLPDNGKEALPPRDVTPTLEDLELQAKVLLDEPSS
jgi:hypothetical protein